MDPDYVAFRELLRLAERNPDIAAELTRLMWAGAPLGEVPALLLHDSQGSASGPAQRGLLAGPLESIRDGLIV